MKTIQKSCQHKLMAVKPHSNERSTKSPASHGRHFSDRECLHSHNLHPVLRFGLDAVHARQIAPWEYGTLSISRYHPSTCTTRNAENVAVHPAKSRDIGRFCMEPSVPLTSCLRPCPKRRWERKYATPHTNAPSRKMILFRRRLTRK